MTLPATGLRSGTRRRTFVTMFLAVTLAFGVLATGSSSLPIAGATNYSAGGWTSAGLSTPTALKPGQTVTVQAVIVASSNRHGQVSVEVHSPTTKTVYQKSWSFQWFWKGKPQTFKVPFTVPLGSEVGQYTVKVRLSDVWSRKTQHLNQSATAFSVSALSTPAPAPTPSPTTAAPTTAPPATAPPATSPPATAAPTTAPPATTPPATAPPATTPPGTVAPPTVGLPPTGTMLWSEDFSSPTSMNRLIKHISFGDNVANGAAMQTFNGDHNHECGGPTTGRSLVENYQVSTHFWYCAPGGDAAKGHFMTGINTEGYVIMAFAPAADNGTTARVFPATANQICWDQNITELGARKWTQLVVVNADRYAANGNRIDYINPEFNDNGGSGSRAAVRLAGDDFLLNNLRNTAHFFNGQTKTYSDWNGLHNITDKATRYTICVRDNGNGTVTRTQARPGGAVAVSTGPGRFPAGPRVFILEDDSYNPMKAFQDGQEQVVTDPFTWHWDNIRVSSS